MSSIKGKTSSTGIGTHIFFNQVALGSTVANQLDAEGESGLSRVRHTVGSKQGVKPVVSHNQAIICIVAKAPQNNVAQDVKQDDIVLIEGVEFFQQLHRLAYDIATATRTCWGPPLRHNQRRRSVDYIFRPHIFVVVILLLKRE